MAIFEFDLVKVYDSSENINKARDSMCIRATMITRLASMTGGEEMSIFPINIITSDKAKRTQKTHHGADEKSKQARKTQRIPG